MSNAQYSTYNFVASLPEMLRNKIPAQLLAQAQQHRPFFAFKAARIVENYIGLSFVDFKTTERDDKSEVKDFTFQLNLVGRLEAVQGGGCQLVQMSKSGQQQQASEIWLQGFKTNSLLFSDCVSNGLISAADAPVVMRHAKIWDQMGQHQVNGRMSSRMYDDSLMINFDGKEIPASKLRIRFTPASNEGGFLFQLTTSEYNDGNGTVNRAFRLTNLTFSEFRVTGHGSNGGAVVESAARVDASQFMAMLQMQTPVQPVAPVAPVQPAQPAQPVHVAQPMPVYTNGVAPAPAPATQSYYIDTEF